MLCARVILNNFAMIHMHAQSAYKAVYEHRDINGRRIVGKVPLFCLDLFVMVAHSYSRLSIWPTVMQNIRVYMRKVMPAACACSIYNTKLMTCHDSKHLFKRHELFIDRVLYSWTSIKTCISHASVQLAAACAFSWRKIAASCRSSLQFFQCRSL